jgi:hypothetical protein
MGRGIGQGEGGGLGLWELSWNLVVLAWSGSSFVVMNWHSD